MAWYELDEWDALGAAGEGVKQTLEKVATHVEQFSANMTRLSADAAARAEYARLMWQNLDELSNAMIRGLDSVDRSRLDAQLIARVEAMRTELGKMRSFAAIAAEADTVAKGMLGIGAQLGGLISAAQLLWVLKDPSASSYEVGGVAMGISRTGSGSELFAGSGDRFYQIHDVDIFYRCETDQPVCQREFRHRNVIRAEWPDDGICEVRNAWRQASGDSLCR